MEQLVKSQNSTAK